MNYLDTIDKLRSFGYLVEKLTSHQHRIECVLDLYSRYRWHNLATNHRGGWHEMKTENLRHFIDQQVAIADAILDREIALGRIVEENKNHGPWLKSDAAWHTKYTKVQR